MSRGGLIALRGFFGEERARFMLWRYGCGMGVALFATRSQQVAMDEVWKEGSR